MLQHRRNLYRPIQQCCRPMLTQNFISTSRVRSSSNWSIVSTWTRMKHFLKSYGPVFIIVKLSSAPPLFYMCYNIPSLFGYETITSFIRSQDWVKKWVDIEHHLAEPDPDAEPPKFVKFIRGGASLVGIELSPYFTSTQVVIDFAGTFLIYEFVIAPVKWPYYFITTRFIVNQLIKRGYLARKVVEKEAKYLHKKEALKGQVKTKLGEIKSSRKIRE